MWNRETVREEMATDVTETETRRSVTRATGSSIIGANMTIKGEVSGTEDLEVFGKIEGNVTLMTSTVTLREGGFLQGTIHAKDIEIQGKVQGDLVAKDRVLLKSTANMDGKIVGARVVLEDGCQFKGVIDMEDTSRGNMNVIAGGRSTPNEAAANKTKEG